MTPRPPKVGRHGGKTQTHTVWQIGNGCYNVISVMCALSQQICIYLASCAWQYTSLPNKHSALRAIADKAIANKKNRRYGEYAS